MNPPKKKVGRKRKEIDLSRVEYLAGLGLNEEQVAQSLGVAVSTFYDRKAKNPEFSKALQKGQAKGIEIVTNCLMEQCRAGNVTAQIFYLKARAGWKDRLEVSGDKENPVRVVISDRELTAEEWEQKQLEFDEKVIDGEVVDFDENL